MSSGGGSVLAIYITPEPEGPMAAVESVRAVAGRGLEGDRFFVRGPGLPRKQGPDREVTLIEVEAIEAMGKDKQPELNADESRRNIVTRGVPLNHLVAREFRVGEVVLRGIRLCEPCNHLEKLTRPGMISALLHRGGLRAQVVVGGTIRVGDEVAT